MRARVLGVGKKLREDAAMPDVGARTPRGPYCSHINTVGWLVGDDERGQYSPHTVPSLTAVFPSQRDLNRGAFSGGSIPFVRRTSPTARTFNAAAVCAASVRR